MTRDEIERMARNKYDIYAFTAESLAEFATLVAAAEREEILKLADSLGWIDSDAIRARGKA